MIYRIAVTTIINTKRTIISDPFVELNGKADMKVVHELLCPDLDLVSLNFEYTELCQDAKLKKLGLAKLTAHLATNGDASTNKEIFLAFARLLAATPHSADVERSISANNRLKTPLRSSIEIDTENKYLYVHFNMPPLIDWNPRNAVINWLNKKSRREHEIKIENCRRKAKYQRYFKGVFTQIDPNEGVDDDETLDDIINVQQSKRPNQNRS